MTRMRHVAVSGAFVLLLTLGCGETDSTAGEGAVRDPTPQVGALHPERLSPWPLDSCAQASPLVVHLRGGPHLLVAPGSGRLVAFDLERGVEAWALVLETPEGRIGWPVATPVADGRRLFVAFQTLGERGMREGHFVAVVDLETGALDPAFSLVELAASRRNADDTADVAFVPRQALSRSELKLGKTRTNPEGLLYVAFGNPRDIQPWHGWVFELDVARWRTQGARGAVSSVLLTTPESECPVEGQSGSMDTICGGGVWAPGGPLLHPRGGTFELFVPTGNGQLDIPRGDFANTLMRTGPGLDFESGCDAARCTPFDPADPSPACLESCANLFVPRLAPGDAPLRMADGACDGKSLLECYALHDYDLGANAPVRVETASGRALLALPGKDGALYLIDAGHLSRLHARAVVTEPCGAPGDPCRDAWAGMMATEPVVATLDGDPLLVVTSFVRDRTHPAGLAAYRVEDGDPAALHLVWRAPPHGDPEAVSRFRTWPGRPVLHEVDGTPYVIVVDVDDAGGPATMLLVRLRDGAIAARVQLAGRGRRFVQPVVHADVAYTISCDPHRLERVRLRSP